MYEVSKSTKGDVVFPTEAEKNLSSALSRSAGEMLSRVIGDWFVTAKIVELANAYTVVAVNRETARCVDH